MIELGLFILFFAAGCLFGFCLGGSWMLKKIKKDVLRL